MNRKSIAAAITEARRFIARAEEAKKRQEQDHPGYDFFITGTKESGAARRASLDLTRVLADLRRPG